MIPNLSELVRDVPLCLRCYGDKGRVGGLTGDKLGEATVMIHDTNVHDQNCRNGENQRPC